MGPALALSIAMMLTSQGASETTSQASPEKEIKPAQVVWQVSHRGFRSPEDILHLKNIIRNAAVVNLSVKVTDPFVIPLTPPSLGCPEQCIQDILVRKPAYKMLIAYWGGKQPGKELVLKLVSTKGRIKAVQIRLNLRIPRGAWRPKITRAIADLAAGRNVEPVEGYEAIDAEPVFVELPDYVKQQQTGMSIIVAGVVLGLVTGGLVVAEDTRSSYASSDARRNGILVGLTTMIAGVSIGLPMLWSGFNDEIWSQSESESELAKRPLNAPSPLGLSFSGEF